MGYAVYLVPVCSRILPIRLARGIYKIGRAIPGDHLFIGFATHDVGELRIIEILRPALLCNEAKLEKYPDQRQCLKANQYDADETRIDNEKCLLALKKGVGPTANYRNR